MNNVKEKTILVTGATGFIGKRLLKRLNEVPFKKIITISRKNNIKNKKSRVVNLSKPLEELSYKFWINNGIKKIDIICHLGAFIPKKYNQASDLKNIYNSNIKGTYKLLNSLPNIAEKILFSSTVDVYDKSHKRQIINELSSIGQDNFYGLSKIICENIIKLYAKKNNCSYALLRYGHIYGPGEERYQKVIPVTIKKLIKKENPVIFGDGKELRDYLYIDDLVEAVLRVLWTKEKEIGPLNIVRGKSYKIIDVVKILIKLTNNKSKIIFKENKCESRSIRFDNSEMIRVLGDMNYTQIEEGLKREIKYLKNEKNIDS